MKILIISRRWTQNIEESKNFKALTEKAEVDLTSENDQSVLTTMVKDVDIIITQAPLSAEIINQAKQLKMIQTTTVGYNQIDVCSRKKRSHHM